MDYLTKTFTVSAPGSQQYRDNWERTFRGENPMPDDTSMKTQLDAMLKAASAPAAPPIAPNAPTPEPVSPTVSEAPMAAPIIIHSRAEFDAAVAAAKGPIAVEFVMEDCMYCEESKEEMAKLLATCPGALTALRVDVDEVGEVANDFDVDGAPTVLFATDAAHFKPGKVKELEPAQIRRKLKCARVKR